MDMNYSVLIFALILVVLQVAVIYSVGKGASLKNFKLSFPNMNEWVTIVIAIVLIGLVGGFVGSNLLGINMNNNNGLY
jgi:hypothetical protein